jgi:hypothetical protein
VALKAYRKVHQPLQVELPASQAQAIRLETSEEAEVPVYEIAVRSDAATGELCWSAERDGGGSPRIVFSPGQSYRVRTLGKGENANVALWSQVAGNDWTIKAVGRNVFACKFRVRDDGPAVKDPRVALAFPDGKMEFPVTDDTVLLSNRRFLSIAYQFRLQDGRVVSFRPQLGEIKKNQVFTVGGPLTPVAWASVIVRKLIDKPDTQHLVWGSDLYDEQGYLVNLAESQIDWSATLKTPWGEVPTDRELNKAEAQLLNHAARPMSVTVSCRLEHAGSRTLQPVNFARFGTTQLHTSAPPHWGLQAVNYLAKAQRIYHCVEEIEMKPAHHKLEIIWSNAKFVAFGGGERVWMPFSGLCDSFDHYATPWALAHEILHTFGYQHGIVMKQTEKAVAQRLELFRWYMADHPELDPASAFASFRVFQRGSLWYPEDSSEEDARNELVPTRSVEEGGMPRKPKKTEAAGGKGRDPFEDLAAPGQLMVGLIVTEGNSSGYHVISSVRPVYASPDGRHMESRVYGTPSDKTTKLIARPGYAVAGMRVKSGIFVDGFEVIFMRIGDDGLVPDDTYVSDWVGGPGGAKEQKLGGDGRPVIGIYGECGTIVPRLGLLQDQ